LQAVRSAPINIFNGWKRAEEFAMRLLPSLLLLSLASCPIDRPIRRAGLTDSVETI
jgi:hypothetical protein